MNILFPYKYTQSAFPGQFRLSLAKSLVQIQVRTSGQVEVYLFGKEEMSLYPEDTYRTFPLELQRLFHWCSFISVCVGGVVVVVVGLGRNELPHKQSPCSQEGNREHTSRPTGNISSDPQCGLGKCAYSHGLRQRVLFAQGRRGTSGGHLKCITLATCCTVGPELAPPTHLCV